MHSPHWGEKSVTTWSPTSTDVTPSPTASTTPAPSCPSTAGAYPEGSAPDAVYMSVWHTPQATRRTSASPACGSASSTSWTASGAPNSSRTAALILTCASLRNHLLLQRDRERDEPPRRDAREERL